jgi:uncharacterized protein YggE
VALASLTALAVAVGITFAVAEGSGPSPAAAAAPAPNSVTVSGTGTVEGVPDTLVASLRAHARQPTVQTALNASASAARKVISVFRGHAVASRDIRTTGISLNPHYDNHGVIDGYDSSESLSVRLHPLSRAGDILSAAVAAAGNAVNVQGVSLVIGDNSTLLSAARAAAFANAKAAAAQYASLGGTTLGHVERITAAVHNASPVFHRAAVSDQAFASAGTAGGASLPIRAGTKKVRVTVNVIWALG